MSTSIAAVSSNETTTTNGAVAYHSTLNATLDMYSRIAAMRNAQDADVIALFDKAYSENKELALKCLFYVADIRGGQGERRVFKTILNHLAKIDPNTLVKNIHLIPEYSRWDHAIDLIDTGIAMEVITLIRHQFDKDIANFAEGKPISLLAKWMPSATTSSKATRLQAKKVMKGLGLEEKMYRKTLSQLREALSIVERSMSSGDWTSIDFNKVPSKASILYRKAFKKHEDARYTQWQEDVAAGVDGAKINASTVYPYELYNQCKQGAWDQTVENSWKALPNYVEANSAIVLADVSGSMSGAPMSVSVSLAVYFAERNTGAFHNRFITFSSTPELELVHGRDLNEKFNNLERSSWGMSTNIEAAFQLILDTAVFGKVKPEDMPKTIIVVSDMQFNAHVGGKCTSDTIKKNYENAGYNIPNIIWHNVSGSSSVPITKDETGMALVSGSSPTIFKAVIEYLKTGKVLTPQDFMIETLSSERYQKISV